MEEWKGWWSGRKISGRWWSLIVVQTRCGIAHGEVDEQWGVENGWSGGEEMGRGWEWVGWGRKRGKAVGRAFS